MSSVFDLAGDEKNKIQKGNISVIHPSIFLCAEKGSYFYLVKKTFTFLLLVDRTIILFQEQLGSEHCNRGRGRYGFATGVYDFRGGGFISFHIQHILSRARTGC